MAHRTKAFRLAVVIGVACLVLALSLPSIALGIGVTPIYRFYNVKTGTHFYTASAVEKDAVIAKYPAVFTYEGVAYNVDSSMDKPLYRFYNKTTGAHFYTASEFEKSNTIAKYAAAFTFEGVAYNVSLDPAGHGPVYRFYNGSTGAHFYTVSAAERDAVIAKYKAFAFEGVAFYVVAPPAPPVADTTAPVTLSDALSSYRGDPVVVRLSATDAASGVKNTYYKLDGGLQVAGTSIVVTGYGSHTIKFWSVDAAGNVEAEKTATFVIGDAHAPISMADYSSCANHACHTGSLIEIHAATDSGCLACHGAGKTPDFKCKTCHTTSTAPIPDIMEGGYHFNTFAASHAIQAEDKAEGGCAEAGCHGTATGDLRTVHTQMGVSCDDCHTADRSVDSDNPLSFGMSCADCHNGEDAVEPAHLALGAVQHKVAGPCYSSGCHITVGANMVSDVAKLHGSGALQAKNPGCAACHWASGTKANTTLSLTCFSSSCHGAAGATLESVHAYGHKSFEATCESCHGKAPAAHETVGCNCHTTGAYHPDVIGAAINDGADISCADCHKGAHAAHGFTNGVSHGEGWVAAGGHNTTIYGSIGALTKWDGSENDVIVRDSAGDVITQEWPLPTSGVFWSQTKALGSDGSVIGGITASASVWAASINPTDSPAIAMSNRGGTDMASKIDTTVGWDSVITCEDCHAGLTGLVGPQGANAANFGIDPNFPDDWTRAEITSFDPTGMRSIETTRGGTAPIWNPFYGVYGGNVWYGGTSGTETTQQPAVVGGPKVTIYPGGFYNQGNQIAGAGYSAAIGPMKNGTVQGGRFICQKCHKLTNSFQGLGIEGNGRGFRSNNANYMGFANEAHMEHHADMTTGQGNCVSCHIAIPHGWNRPRLLVYESDPLPYKVQWVYKDYRNAGASSDSGGSAKSLGNDLGATIAAWTPAAGYATQTLNGNWGWLGGGTTLYQVVGAQIPDGTATGTNGLDEAGAVIHNEGKFFSTHLEKLSASDHAEKVLVKGPATMGAPYDNQQVIPTKWGLWSGTLLGSEWEPDTSPNALYAGEAIQNNCTACTSAGLTHSDTGGTSEGVADNTSNPDRHTTNLEGHEATPDWHQVPWWR